jgi:hypothetical protein
VHRGDIIVFNEPVGDHHVTTHRVVKVLKPGKLPLVQTRGDANNTDDPFQLQLQGNEAWYVRGHAPKVGYAIHALRSPMVKIAAFACLGLLAITSLWSIWFGGTREDDDLEPADG